MNAINRQVSVLGAVYDLEILQTPTETAAVVDGFTQFTVSATNNASLTLSDIDLQFAHVNGGSIVREAHYYETSSSLCTILGNTLSAAEEVVDTGIQNTGTLSCTIASIAPGETVSFSYKVLIDATPPILNTQAYYHEIVEVNRIPQLESLVCIPVFSTFVAAGAGSSVCDAVQASPLDFGPQATAIASLDDVATVTGNRLSVPFIRLEDGGLISAEFQITFFGEVRFELLSHQVLDGSLSPVAEASFTAAGILSLSNLLVGGLRYDISATLEPDTDPVKLGALSITALSSTL